MRLLRRFRSEATIAEDSEANTLRTVGDLVARAEAMREEHDAKLARRAERERRRREKAIAAARAERLDALAKRQTAAWNDIEKLVSSKKPKAYEAAIAVIKDLHDVAEREGDGEAFARRLGALRARHERKASFIRRLREAGLDKS